MSAVDRLTIDQHWDRLVTLARKAGATTTDQWVLVEGQESQDGRQREPWEVRDTTGLTVMTLGYTRREVAASLLAMNTILAVVLGG